MRPNPEPVFSAVNDPRLDARLCDDIIEFFTRVKAGNPCESCGTQDWVILEEASKTAGIPTYTYPGQTASMLEPHFPVVLVACKNCGLLREHLRLLIDRKIAEANNGVET